MHLLIRFFGFPFVASGRGFLAWRSVWRNAAGLVNDYVIVLTVGLVNMRFGVARLRDVNRLPVCPGAATLRNGRHITGSRLIDDGPATSSTWTLTYYRRVATARLHYRNLLPTRLVDDGGILGHSTRARQQGCTHKQNRFHRDQCVEH